ncbi:winged helix-turn-helix domain-containing protein [Litorilituus sediminis]|uniref:OmpR/PhoB-type domain-containing protein n=1 Tax=Litorilituus sediminis TaxID=718192 RepID=A0A4V0ZG05_9GAMM|nr:winged helix-turn-helix domain-containing protein [Litorilituus sediminis]QBG35620.1 hypothetical protein EMK97_07805 [Litorilituus sediminis]
MMQDNSFKIGQYLITPAEFTIQLENREKQSLQPKFIEVLCYLAKHHPRVIPREELIEQVWGENSFVGDKSLTNAIWHLRKNLAQAGEPNEVIETIRKAGYRLLIEPQWLTSPSLEASHNNEPNEALSARQNNKLNKIHYWRSIAAIALVAICFFILDSLFHNPQPTHLVNVQATSQVTKHPGSELFPAPSPDGRFIVYSQISSNKPVDLYMKDITQPALPPKQLTFDNALQGHSVWSNDGRYLYFSRKDKDNNICQYMQLDVHNHQEQVIANCPMRGGYYYLDISPDDNTLAVYNDDDSADDTGIYFIDLSKQNFPMTRFSCANNCAAKDRDMAFSPDGKYIAISRRVNRFNENIHLVNLATKTSEQLTFGEEDIAGLAWHPNGKKIIYAAQRAYIHNGFVFDLASKTSQSLNITGFSYPSFAKQSNQLFYQVRHDNDYIASLAINADIASTPFPVMQSNFSHGSADYSDKAGRIAYVSNESGHFELWSANSNGTERVQLTQLRQNVRYPKWSHDGKKIAFLAPVEGQKGDAIYVYSTLNQKITVLKTPYIKHNRPSWSFDDTKVLSAIYTGQYTDIHSIDIHSNQLERLTFDGGRYGIMASANSLLYTKLKKGLWQKDISANSEAQRIIDKQYFSTIYAWTIDQETVYFHKAKKNYDQLNAFNLASNAMRPIVRLPLNSFSQHEMLSFNPQTQELFFTGSNYPQANIKMLQNAAIFN